MTTQNINPQQLDGQQYVIQWVDTMWEISQATEISIEKLAYDNNIQNINLIFSGDFLILKRDGDVPAGYHVTGNGHRCAHSKIVISNYYGDNNRVIINNTTFVSDDHSKNTMIYAPDNSDNSISFSLIPITTIISIKIKILKKVRSHLLHHQNLKTLHQVQQVLLHLLHQAQQQAAVKVKQVQILLKKKN